MPGAILFAVSARGEDPELMLAISCEGLRRHEGLGLPRVSLGAPLLRASAASPPPLQPALARNSPSFDAVLPPLRFKRALVPLRSPALPAAAPAPSPLHPWPPSKCPFFGRRGPNFQPQLASAAIWACAAPEHALAGLRAPPCAVLARASAARGAVWASFCSFLSFCAFLRMRGGAAHPRGTCSSDSALAPRAHTALPLASPHCSSARFPTSAWPL